MQVAAGSGEATTISRGHTVGRNLCLVFLDVYLKWESTVDGAYYLSNA